MKNTAEKEAAMRLASYKLYKALVDSGNSCEPIADEMALRAEMFKIRRSVMRLPDSKEKILLYNRYIRGETMETCAELIGISRRSVFRLSHRAMEMYLRYNPSGEKVKALS